MATAESVKTKIQNLIATANEATGNADTDLTAAVNSLIAGFGTGGGSDVNGIYMAKITPASDVGALTVAHNLGTTDILMAVCWVETLGDVTPTFNGAVLNLFLKSELPFRTSSSSNHENLFAHGAWGTSSNNVSSMGQPTSASYFPEIKDENTFIFPAAGSAAAKHFAGVTYTVIIMTASAFSAS